MIVRNQLGGIATHAAAPSVTPPRKASAHVHAIKRNPESASMTGYSIDDDWVGALSRLGGLAMTLHRLAATATTNDFQRLAFDALQAELAFDSGIWATGVMDPGPTLHSVFPYNQPPEMMPAWQAMASHDTMLAETLRRPGQTLRATADGPEGCPPFLPEVRDHARRFGMEQVLGTSYIDPALGLVEGFALYRAKPEARFTEPERLLVQHALPHLMEAWRINRLRLIREEHPVSPPALSLAVCDGKGLLRTAGAAFVTLMRQEWPDWRGPKIPAQWLNDTANAFVGHSIAATLEPINDLWLVRLRRRAPLDSLTCRESDIARRFGLGMNYQKIAAELNISPATVRNHLSNAYNKLGVNNKIELAKLFD
jgi:DNA-binding CsgD family transcriptional regulator